MSESLHEYLQSSPTVRLSQMKEIHSVNPFRLQAIRVAPKLISHRQVIDIVLPLFIKSWTEPLSYGYVLTENSSGFLLDLKTGDTYSVGLPGAQVKQAVIRPDDKVDEIALLVPSHESIYFWSAKTGRITRRLPGRDITSIAYSDTGKYLVAGSVANRVFVYSTNWKLAANDNLFSLDLSASVTSVIWHSTKASEIKGRFYVLTSDGYYSLIDINNGKLVRHNLAKRPGDGENRWNNYSLSATESLGTVQLAISNDRNLVAMESDYHENRPVLVHIDREESGKVQHIVWTNGSPYLSIVCQHGIHFLINTREGVRSHSLDGQLPDGFAPVTGYLTEHSAVVVGY